MESFCFFLRVCRPVVVLCISVVFFWLNLEPLNGVIGFMGERIIFLLIFIAFNFRGWGLRKFW
jgi:hypothetical protein